jgi:hypothetical protein
LKSIRFEPDCFCFFGWGLAEPPGAMNSTLMI